jgi:hypothetical protein
VIFINQITNTNFTCLWVVFFALFGRERDKRAAIGLEGELLTIQGSRSVCDCVSSFSTAAAKGKDGDELVGRTVMSDKDLAFSPFL